MKNKLLDSLKYTHEHEPLVKEFCNKLEEVAVNAGLDDIGRSAETAITNFLIWAHCIKGYSLKDDKGE